MGVLVYRQIRYYVVEDANDWLRTRGPECTTTQTLSSALEIFLPPLSIDVIFFFEQKYFKSARQPSCGGI